MQKLNTILNLSKGLENSTEKQQLESFKCKFFCQFDLQILAMSKFSSIRKLVASNAKTHKDTLKYLILNDTDINVIIEAINNINVDLTKEELKEISNYFYQEKDINTFLIVNQELKNRNKKALFNKVISFIK